MNKRYCLYQIEAYLISRAKKIENSIDANYLQKNIQYLSLLKWKISNYKSTIRLFRDPYFTYNLLEKTIFNIKIILKVCVEKLVKYV